MMMEPGTAKRVLTRLAHAGLVQTLIESCVSVLVFVEAGLWSESPYKDSAYQIVIFFANLQRGWIMRELLRKLAITQDGEPDISGALGGIMRVFLFNPLALAQWYILQFVMRGAEIHELPVFVFLAALNLGHCAWWFKTLRRLSWGRQQPPDIQRLTVSGAAVEEFMGHNCVICLSDFVEGDEVGRLPCGHNFHDACIREWLKRGEQCPMRCRANAPNGPLPRSFASASTSVGEGVQERSMSFSSVEEYENQASLAQAGAAIVGQIPGEAPGEAGVPEEARAPAQRAPSREEAVGAPQTEEARREFVIAVEVAPETESNNVAELSRSCGIVGVGEQRACYRV